MDIQLATISDAPSIHELMNKAFIRYQNSEFPSSALEETIESITDAMKNGEQAFICYFKQSPVGMVRFRQTENTVYFYRLSVIPEAQGKGFAKKLLASLEAYAKEMHIAKLYCKVRRSETKNINLYESIGYVIVEESMVHKQNGIMKIVRMEKRLEA